jgi:2-hydroxy-3-oxopropionate reductase
VKTVAFIGLGVMGSPMAVHLARAGHRVQGFNRSPGKAAALLTAGGWEAHSVAEAVRGADIVAIMVPDSPDVEAVLTDGGVLAHAAPGALIIDFSTIRPDVARRLAERAAAAGLRMLDAPVSGGEQGAVNAALSIMVGGERADFEAAQPVFDAVGATVVHVGPSGAGQTVKAANQLMVAAHLQALAEAVVFLEAHGVDTEAGLKVLAGGLAGSKVLEQKAANVLARSFKPGFRISLHNKDLGIVTSAAKEAGVVLPMGTQLAQLMLDAVAAGDGELDHSALVRGALRHSGRPVD